MEDNNLPKATHAGELRVGDAVIPCAVLEDGRRVLTQQGFLKAIGRARSAKGGQGSSVDGMIPFLAAKNLQAFVDTDVKEQLRPFEFRTVGGRMAYGFNAEALPKVCDIYLRARDANALLRGQYRIAMECDILVRSLATVGIVALVDEATGYQRDRASDALAELLKQLISDELRRWVKTFPDEFYRELFRVYGLTYSEFTSKRPAFIGKLTKDLVYERLAPDVVKELEMRNPVLPSGRRQHKHFQWLTVDQGHPKLKEHLYALIIMLRLAPTNGKDVFYANVQQALPKWSDKLQAKLELN
ncbi:MAG: P63C domain-containing protein [Fimbriimonadaceae bacterium]